jgi:hypothetical protein
MAANIGTAISGWSTTASSNQPDSTDLASTMREDLQAIQAAVRFLRTSGTIASAGTTDLATKSEEILSVSGTTTITALGTVSAGMIKVLVFEGALVLTHNNTSLILPDALNITTAAGDTAVVLSLGSGNWRCIDYHYADNVGTWTPTLTFATAGNLSVSYSIQSGAWQRFGKMVCAQFVISTSAFTHTTASGRFRVTGLPFTTADITGIRFSGPLQFQGLSAFEYTQIVPRIDNNSNIIEFNASGTGKSNFFLEVSNVPTSGSVVLLGSIVFQAA